LIAASWLFVGPSVARGEEFCALTVKLTSAASFPPASTRVELVDQSGKVELREETPGSTFKICDFGFGPHTLRIGTNECLPVSVSNLRVIFGAPIHLDVFMNLCGYQDTMRNACLLYLRAVDREGKPVPAADVSMEPPPAVSLKTDSFGRFQGLFRGSREIALAKEGFEATSAKAQCKNSEEIDVTIFMDKIKAPNR